MGMISEFQIAKNIKNCKVSNYKPVLRKLSVSTPYSVDHVKIVSKLNPDVCKEIITYKDAEGKIIERIFDYSDKKYNTHRIYKYDENFNNRLKKRSEQEVVSSRTMKEYHIDKDEEKFYTKNKKTLSAKLKKLIPEKTEVFHVAENLHKDKTYITKTETVKNGSDDCEIHRFIEYSPIIDNVVVKSKNKQLAFLIDFLRDKIKILPETTSDIKIPENDSFLECRALDTDELKFRAANKFLKELGLDDANVKINTAYTPKKNEEHNLDAFFSSKKGVINFVKNNSDKSKIDVINTARHEVEHVKQFYLYSRLTGGFYNWERQIFKKFGALRSLKLRVEAMKYKEAIENYVPASVNLKKYRHNYIELKAREKGNEAAIKYRLEGLELKRNFPHIPENLL